MVNHREAMVDIWVANGLDSHGGRYMRFLKMGNPSKMEGLLVK